MFYRYLILKEAQEEILLLFISNSFEFSNDFIKRKENNNLYNRVKYFIKNKGIIFNGYKVYLVLNGLLIASLNIKKENYKKTSLNDLLKKRYHYSEISKEFINNKDIIELIDNGHIYVIPK
ncbi:MAG: hypothetical protein GX861_03290 [Tenericutes bacterium]|nr:hypothetical protein [Mycoplasmatota bacterium]